VSSDARGQLPDGRSWRHTQHRGGPLVHDAVAQRDLMRVSGNTDLAARWQAIVDRHARMLADRDRAIALMLWF
jgi:hypothetical protein